MVSDRLISTAPMLDYSDRHCRYFWRLFSPHAWLYTEMVHSNAILLGKRNQVLAFDEEEHPIALQLGGHDPQSLAQCVQYAQAQGYDEVNLNVGCPSDRVQSGQFGACLMRDPLRVAECVAAMKAVSTIPITVKTRIGVDHDDSYAFLAHFIATVAEAGCNVFIIHARKAWLKGVSPKQNRMLPPLLPERVHQLKRDFPSLLFILNGGLNNSAMVKTQGVGLAGVMVGREIYNNPFFLAELEQHFYGTPIPTREIILEKYLAYVQQQLTQGVRANRLSKPLMGLYYGRPCARRWRTLLSRPDASLSIATLNAFLSS